MHGLNQIILDTGLAVGYNEVSEDAEKLRPGVGADGFEIDFEVESQVYTLRLQTNGQSAQKSHGLCPGKGDVANLPAEVYFVPDSAEGVFPFKYGMVPLVCCVKTALSSAHNLSTETRSD